MYVNKLQIDSTYCLFFSFPLSEKIKIKQAERPTPVLNLTQQDKVGARSFTRHFSAEIYNKFKWICGCKTSNSLYCFPCVLFHTDLTDKTWSVTGFKDLKHLNQRARKHEISTRHITCCTELALLGSVNIAAQLDSVTKENLELYKILWKVGTRIKRA